MLRTLATVAVALTTISTLSGFAGPEPDTSPIREHYWAVDLRVPEDVICMATTRAARQQSRWSVARRATRCYRALMGATCGISRRGLRMRSKDITDAADLAIAATAIRTDRDLLTRNVKHFPMFPDLRALY